MSEENVVIGQIKVNVMAQGKPQVTITGRIPTGVITRAAPMLRKAYRIHINKLTRDARKVDMSDPGLKLHEVPDIEKIEANPAPPGKLQMPPDLSSPPIVDQFIPDGDSEDKFDDIKEQAEQANNLKKSEEDNGPDEGTEGIRSTDEESGSEGRPAWQVG